MDGDKFYPCLNPDCKNYWEEDTDRLKRMWPKESLNLFERVLACAACRKFVVKPDLYVAKQEDAA